MMDGAWIVGPIIIQKHWLLYIASISIAYVVFRIAVNNKQIADILWNGFFVFFVIWKASYALFHPAAVIQHPLSMLYFHGGSKGVMLGFIGAAGYFLWKSKRSAVTFSQMMEAALIAGLSAVGAYRLLSWLVFASSDGLLFLGGLASFAILAYWYKSKDWLASLCLLSFAEFVLMLLDGRKSVFSLELWFSVVVVMICLFFPLFQSKERFVQLLKRVAPVGLLGSLMLWASYDLGRTFDIFHAKSEEETVETGIATGDKASDFELVSLEGENVKLSDFHGKRVILTFWATWCPPCRAEMPDMQKYYEEFGKAGNVVIVSVNVTKTESHPNRVREFADKYGITFPILLDESSDVTDRYEVAAYPTSFFIDEQGIICYKKVGPMNMEFMRNQVRGME